VTTSTGEWRDHVIDWRRDGGVHCELCGRLLPRRAWVVDVNGESRRFCEPECEALYRELRVK
jgi:hypothetical protein